MSQNARKIGVFGGAFDPPHNAHIALAKAAVEELALDALHVIPTGQAWHKARNLSPAIHRLAMARLAFKNMPRVEVDDREIKRAGPTFTIDTLQVLQSENLGAQLYLLMGADQFSAFEQWHQWREIMKIAIICIAARAHFTLATSQFNAQNELKSGIVTLYMPQMAVSATQIRQSFSSGLGENQAVADLIPHPVASYIAQHQLYKALQT